MKTNQTKPISSSMLRVRCWMLNVTFLATASSALAEVHYVDVNSTNATPPYSSWSTAATNIQDAVDAAVAGDEIVVTNGTYSTGGRAVYGTTIRVLVDKPLTVRSVNGPESTFISGGHRIACAYLTNAACLSGFTLRGSSVGGVWCRGYENVVSNCVITSNSTLYDGGGVTGGTLYNCTITRNTCGQDFGVRWSVARGGGANFCILNNCTLSNNSNQGALDSLGGGAYECILKNCTIVGNLAGSGGGAYECSLVNCVVYNNIGNNFTSCRLYSSCTTPLPPDGVGNITSAPLFVDPVAGNYRLQSNSPCINAGQGADPGPDLDGNPRIAGGTVDIGAYEFQSPASTISYAWLQQFNLPINPATDTADPDGDGMNNWQEWRCATDPTNALSALRVLAPTVLGSDLLLRWESVSDRTYFLERSMNLSSAFTPLAADIPGQPGTTSFTHTNAIPAGPWFYRVGVSIP